MVYTVAVAAVVNIGLNLALIPSLHEIGAALAMLVSMVVYVIVAMWMAILEVGRMRWTSMLAAPFAAAAAMAAPLIWLGDSLPLALAAGLPVYLAVYAAVDAIVDPDDLRFVIDLVKRRLPSGRRAAQADAT
jgi:O-antigen/teichoic acid export membrane protein